jgi:hypothetical protein
MMYNGSRGKNKNMRVNYACVANKDEGIFIIGIPHGIPFLSKLLLLSGFGIVSLVE